MEPQDALFQSPRFGFESEAFRNNYIKAFCKKFKLDYDYTVTFEEIQTFVIYGLITEETDKLFFQSMLQLIKY